MANLISQAKIYVDGGATTGGAPGAAVLLEFATSLKETDGRSTEVVKAIGNAEGAGFRRKAGGRTLALTENRQDRPQIPWKQWCRDGKVFSITVQDENGGTRQKYFQCMVSKVDMSLSDEGEHQHEIEVVALRARP